ncbi:MAG: metal-dependent hydrolase, partial [Proteobacteria bacterium]|nr:metal-dependent hydrolase [Pseudomonadota bacterium]
SHALLSAVIVAAALALVLPLGQSRGKVFAFLALAMASHGLLDTLTNGGYGVALAWPLSDARYFAPYRPIAVSPIGAAFFSERGLRVIFSELTWIWMPLLGAAGLAALLRRHRANA